MATKHVINEEQYAGDRIQGKRHNQAIAAYTEKHPDLMGMGSTLVAVVIKKDTIQWISVGD